MLNSELSNEPAALAQQTEIGEEQEEDQKEEEEQDWCRVASMEVEEEEKEELVIERAETVWEVERRLGHALSQSHRGTGGPRMDHAPSQTAWEAGQRMDHASSLSSIKSEHKYESPRQDFQNVV